MESIRKKNLVAGIITGIISLFLFVILGSLRFGTDAFRGENLEIALFFFPIWSCIFGMCGYTISKYYYKKKTELMSLYPEKSEVENNIIWENYTYWMLYKVFSFLWKAFLVVFPGYLLAYFDNSEYLKSSISMLVTIALLAIISVVLSVFFKRKYK